MKEDPEVDLLYVEGSDPIETEGPTLRSVKGYCFCGDEMVIVKHPKYGWMPPGGGMELGETWQEATIREVHEETNMKVLHQELIGFQDFHKSTGQSGRETRSLCMVEPYGEFIADPSGDIQEIKLIDPADYKEYFDWGEIGDHIMKKALELKEKFK